MSEKGKITEAGKVEPEAEHNVIKNDGCLF